MIDILQIAACEDVSEVWQGRFWELVPGQAVGSVSIRVNKTLDTVAAKPIICTEAIPDVGCFALRYIGEERRRRPGSP